MRQMPASLVLSFILLGPIGPAALTGRASEPIALVQKGAIQVEIGPEGAALPGAAWRLDDHPLRAPGAVEGDLAPGRYMLRFARVAGWVEPPEQEVLVAGSATRSMGFEYRPLPAYYFKSIPPHTARPGAPIRIVVLSSDPGDPQSPAPGTALNASFSPEPAGAISFDPASGELSYLVHPDDRRDFTATFRTGASVGSMAITPAPALPPEDAVLSFDRPMPDPLSRDYIQITEAKSKDPATFNLREGLHPRSVSISGRQLLFEAGSTQSDLHARYDLDHDLKELKLYAETIIIRNPLRLPSTHLVIHARELRFEGNGSIDVTPPDWFAGKPEPVAPEGTMANVSANGLSAPPMELHLERLHSDPDPQNPQLPPRRFILRGARGQDAGEGRDGRQNFLPPGIVFCGISGGRPIIYSGCILPDGSRDNECGQETIYGESAVSAGLPGRGGAGGAFTSPFGPEMAFLLDLEGAPHGEPGLDRVGGTIGGTFVVETWRTSAGGEPCALVGRATVTASRGAAAPAPRQPCVCIEWRQKDAATIAEECGAIVAAEIEQCTANCEEDPRVCAGVCRRAGIELQAACVQNPGAYMSLEVCAQFRCTPDPGRLLQATDARAWLHPLLVRSTLLFARDAYLNERIPEARAILEEYQVLITALKGDLPMGEEADQFAQLMEEIESLLHRIEANLDYFGNPVTWVPLLSFEANLAAFTEELERAIPTLYLGYWVQVAAQKARNTRDAAVAAKERLDQELEVLIVDHALAQEEMPALMAEAEALGAKVAAATANLAALEAALVKRAQENVSERHKLPLWQKAVGVMGAVTKMIPLGQPALGYVGVGLGLLSRFDIDKPLENLDKLPDLIEAVKKNPYALCATGKAQESKTEPKKEKKATLIERAKACKDILKAGVKEIREALKDTKADQKEVQAELEKLRASDGVFAQATRELEELNAEKKQLGERVAATLDKLTSFSSSVSENLLASDQLDRDLTGALDALDHSSVVYISDMAKRTSDRLLLYQYLMAKAYQYRTLRHYTGNLRLGRILLRVRELVDFQDSEPVLSPDQFDALKAIYLEEIGRIAQDILEDLEQNGPERSAPVSFRLTAAELAALNGQGAVEIDLARKGLFGVNQEDLRIASIETQELMPRVVGAIGTTATMRLTLEHSGYSRISKGGQTYLFTHYRTERVNPIAWTTVYDGLSDTTTETEVSAATESLLRFLLGLSSAEDVLLYSLPSAQARLVLTREVTADNGVDILVDGLTLRLRYDYAQASTALRRLEVQVSDGLAPRILLGGEDQNGRRDGEGEFIRSFSGPATVTLEAPPTHGAWEFDHWELPAGPGGGGLLDSRVIEVPLDTRTVVRAVYHSTEEPPAAAFIRGDSNDDGRVNISDASHMLSWLFLGGEDPRCAKAADSDDSGKVNITDPVTLLGFLFLGGERPPAPYPDAGSDPTADDLDC